MSNRLISMISATIVTLVLLLVVVVPLVGAMHDVAEDAYSENASEGAMRMAKSGTYTGTVAFGSSGITVGGAAFTGAYLLAADSIMIYTPAGQTYIDVLYKPDVGTVSASRITTETTVTFSGTSWTLVNGGTTASGTISMALVPDAEGDYIMTNLPKYVDTGKEFYVFGTVPSFGVGLVGGTLDSLDVILTGGSAVITGASAVSTPTAFSNELTKVVLTLSNDTAIDRTTYFIVPLEYQSMSPPNPLVGQLVALTPVLLIVGMIVGIAVAVVYKRASGEY